METKHAEPVCGSNDLSLTPANAMPVAQDSNAEEGFQWEVIRSWLSRAGMLHVDAPQRTAITG